jgi:hypothetical protein
MLLFMHDETAQRYFKKIVKGNHLFLPHPTKQANFTFKHSLSMAKQKETAKNTSQLEPY